MAALGPACARAPRDAFLTYFDPDHGVSLRYPASWRAEQLEKDGVFYRHFLAPAADAKEGASVTYLTGPLGVPLDDYAKAYLEGKNLTSSREESRAPARGRAYAFTTTDGGKQYALLLLGEADRVYGLYAQGDKVAYQRHAAVIEEMVKSLALERAEAYALTRNARFAFALRTPPSWRETRSFSGAGGFLLQWTSPALAADKGGQTVHASLTLSVEPVGRDATIEDFYDATRRKLGESFSLLSHKPWRDGFADVMRAETPVSASRVKRFYRLAEGRGYTLAFEARDDAFSRVSRWCDMIAGTLLVGGELSQK